MLLQSFLSFVVIDLALVCVPGPDWLYVIARGMSQGRRIALTAVAGLLLGYAVHTAVAVLGLAAVIAAHPVILDVLRYCGAAYLLWLGVRLLMAARGSGGATEQPTGEARSVATTLRQGALTSLLNPKGLLLYLSLMPQFIGTSSAAFPVSVQMAVFGAAHIALSAGVYAVVAVGAGRAGDRIGARPRMAKRLNGVAGVLLLAVAGMTGASGAA